MAQKKENLTDTEQLGKAEFHKLFGDAPEMRVPAAPEALAAFYRAAGRVPYHLFAVPRELPVSGDDYLPEALIHAPAPVLRAQPGEFFVFQLAVWTPAYALFDLQVSAGSRFAPWRAFRRPGNLGCGKMRSLWIGLEIPADAQGGYDEVFTVHTENCGDRSITVRFEVSGPVLADGGESDDFRMARLRWLDSDIGDEDTVFPPFEPLRRDGRTLRWLGHTLTLGEDGLPSALSSTFHAANSRTDGPALPLLGGAVSFADGGDNFKGRLTFTRETATRIEWRSEGSFKGRPAALEGFAEFDGFLGFTLKLAPSPETISPQLTIEHAQTDCLIGLNRHGGPMPDRVEWCWDVRNWQDGYWLGSLQGGIRVRLKDGQSRPPLLNCYYQFSPLHLPEPWYNQGRGGIRMLSGNQGVNAAMFSGPLAPSPVPLEFSWEMQITPFRTIDAAKHLKDRSYHPHMHSFELGGKDPLEEADFEALKRDGVTRVNIHHAVGMNPIINYPFTELSLGRLQRFVERAHQSGIQVELYYTIRELTVHLPEFWALWSLGDEIFQPGLGQEARPCTSPNGPNAWLSTNLSSTFLSAWAEVIKNGPAANNIDVALETTPESRLENFYLEGLRFLLERCPIDGLYLDDSALSREGFRRAWRIFRRYRGADPIVDFHAWTPFPFGPGRRNFGRNSVVLRDMERMPYFTRLWLGEGFDYAKASPEFYLNEISGLPFGLMGEMLQGGGNPWRGILYGMTARHGWFGDPRPLWRFFDRHRLTDGAIAFDCAAPECRPRDRAIRFSRFTAPDGGEFLALASWAKEPVALTFDCAVAAEAIEGFQPEQEFAAGEPVSVEPGKGWILKIAKKR